MFLSFLCECRCHNMTPNVLTQYWDQASYKQHKNSNAFYCCFRTALIRTATCRLRTRTWVQDHIIAVTVQRNNNMLTTYNTRFGRILCLRTFLEWNFYIQLSLSLLRYCWDRKKSIIICPKWDMRWLRTKEIKNSPTWQAVLKILVRRKWHCLVPHWVRFPFFLTHLHLSRLLNYKFLMLCNSWDIDLVL